MSPRCGRSFTGASERGYRPSAAGIQSANPEHNDTSAPACQATAETVGVEHSLVDLVSVTYGFKSGEVTVVSLGEGFAANAARARRGPIAH